jgi:CheY-like chemotaxis protein
MTQMNPNSQARKALIADDDPGITRFLGDLCGKMGFQVQMATNGLQALVMALRNHPDVLIVDINMPELDGLSLCKRLLQSKEGPVVVLITAGLNSETIGQCETLGVLHVRKGPSFWNDVRSALIEIFPDLAESSAALDLSSLHQIGNRPRILVVDCDPSVETFLSSRLRKCGIDTLFAHDSTQGFGIACRDAPSVIVTDDGNARHLLWKLRETPTTDRIPVFVMNEQYCDRDTELRSLGDLCNRQGKVEFFTKSFDTGELFVALQKVCAFTNSPAEDVPSLPIV